MKIRWLDEAVNDLQSMKNYLDKQNPSAARKVTQKILAAIDVLLEYPAVGRIGRVANTRELLVYSTPYIVAYRIKNNVIEILRILHCAMRWSNDF